MPQPPGNEPIRVRVVVQGGGAKLVVLMAAMEALEDLARDADRKLEPTMVAGTSAGSIAGAMLASPIPMRRFRERLNARGQQRVEAVFLARWKAAQFWRALRGRPFLAEQELSDLLVELFRAEDGRGRPISHFRDLPVPMRIVATDLRNAERKAFGRDPNDRIVDAMLHSCSVPFAFRSHAQTHQFVDGGVCSNLPTAEVIDGLDPGETVLGFSFPLRERPEALGGWWFGQRLRGYVQRLVEVAMATSVADACAMIERVGGKVCRIGTDIGTLDFEAALELLADEARFDALRNQVRDELAEWIDDRRRAVERTRLDPAALPADPPRLQRQVAEIYQMLRARQQLEVPRGALVVTANCLRDAGQPDEIEQLVVLAPGEKPVECYRLAIVARGDTPVSGDPEWRLRDSKGNPRRVLMVLVDSVPEAGPEDLRLHHAPFFFDPPLERDAGPFTLSMVNVQAGAMAGLADPAKGYDFATNSSNQSEPFALADIVVRYPNGFPEPIPADLGERLEEVPEADRPRDAAGRVLSFVRGRRMEPRELADYPDRHGFRAVGWRVHDLAKGQSVGLFLRRRPAPRAPGVCARAREPMSPTGGLSIMEGWTCSGMWCGSPETREGPSGRPGGPFASWPLRARSRVGCAGGGRSRGRAGRPRG